MKETKDAGVTLSLLERGAFMAQLSNELAQTLAHLKQHATYTKKAKGQLTIVLDITVEEGVADIRGEIKPKLPRLPRPKTTLFVTNEGGVSTEHPQQMQMFDGPRVVPEAKSA